MHNIGYIHIHLGRVIGAVTYEQGEISPFIFGTVGNG